MVAFLFAGESASALDGAMPLPPTVVCPENFCHPLPLALRFSVSEVGIPIAGEPGMCVVTAPAYCRVWTVAAIAGGGSWLHGIVITR